MPSSTPRWPRSVCSAAALCRGSLALGVHGARVCVQGCGVGVVCVCMGVGVVFVCVHGCGTVCVVCVCGVHVCVVPCSMMCTVGL